MTGAWGDDGTTGIGVFRRGDGSWRLDQNLDGKAEVVFRWDEIQDGDIALAGDWRGSGGAGPGYFRPRDVSWHLRDHFDHGGETVVLRFGVPNDVPLVGDWDGDGRQTIGIYRSHTGEVVFQNTLAAGSTMHWYGAIPGATPVVGQWAGNRKDSVAFVKNDVWNVRPINCADEPSNPPPSFNFGPKEGRPLSGAWR